jgi:ribonuclease J
MMRIANNDFQGIEIDKDDAVIFSSKIIPGNEKKLYGMFNKLSEMLVEVITEYDEDIHVSGHPCEDEMIDMYNWIKPEISVPVHGEHRHLKYHSELAKSLDVKHPMLIQNGDILRLAPGDPEVIDQCMSGRLYYDGNKLVPSDSYHLSERKRMSFNGILNITCVLNKKLKLSSPPIISCNGIDLYDEFDDDIIDSLEEEIYNFFDNTNNLSKKDSKVHKKLESVSKNFIFKRTRKKPLTNIHLVHI